MTTWHSCIRCRFPSCQRNSCPICKPFDHQHTSKYNPRIFQSVPNCPIGFPLIHDFQETENYFVCRRCGHSYAKPKVKGGLS